MVRHLKSVKFGANRVSGRVYYIIEGRRKKEEGRRKKEEGRGKKEEGRGKKKIFSASLLLFSSTPIFNSFATLLLIQIGLTHPLRNAALWAV
jgi:hypothetical protein